MRLHRSGSGLSQRMLYLTRWYSLGQRPLSEALAFKEALQRGWAIVLDERSRVSEEHPE